MSNRERFLAPLWGATKYELLRDDFEIIVGDDVEKAWRPFGAPLSMSYCATISK